MNKLELVENIIDIEWKMFQKVNNIGGRASCQDDFDTFYIMRRAQYESWSDEMVQFYNGFAEDCMAVGRNLVEEKYARMMAYTDFHYYNKHIKPYIAPVPQENYPVINQVVERMLKWEFEFAEKYPKLSGNGRPITSDGDATGFTSVETYARGELETYPLELLKLYDAYLAQLEAEGKSLSLINQGIMVSLYGYDSIDAAEASLG